MMALVSGGLDASTLTYLAVALIAAGAVAGFLSGLLGIGGGGVLVPVLYEAFGAAGVDDTVRMHLAVGTTLAVIAPTVITSLRAHNARGSVDMVIVRRMAPWVFAGVLAGLVVASQVSGVAMRWIWVVFGTLLAIKTALGSDFGRLADDVPRPPVLEGFGFLIGGASTLMGIGGATFTVPLMTVCGRPILQAIGTATGIGAVIALPGLVGYMVAGYGVPNLPPLSIGYVNLAALLIIPVSMVAAPLGVRMAHGIPKRALELAFAAFIACVVARFVVSLVG